MADRAEKSKKRKAMATEYQFKHRMGIYEFIKRTGVSNETYYKFLDGGDVTNEVLFKFADALEVDPRDIK